MWPFNKKKAAPKRNYAGAQSGRLTSDWMTSNLSADAELRSSLQKLRDRSRELGRNNDYVKSAKRTIRNNVIGQGIGFQAQVKMKRGKKGGAPKLNDAINQVIEDAWAKWCRKENCHTAGKLCFADIERLIIETVFEAGEVLIRKVPQAFGNTKVPFALEIIEPDLLDETYDGRISENGNPIKMGVEADSWGRPVAYYFRYRHPGDYVLGSVEATPGQRRRIPADEILHIFITERAGQTRGVPWLHSTIMRLRHMQGYEEAEVIAARASASLMGFIESPEGEVPADDVMGGERVTDFEPGVIKHLGPGEKMNVPNLQRPGGQFDPFMRMMLRGFGAGVGASYESISKDYSQSNYSSSRLALLDDRDNWKVLQSWLVENFHQPVFEKWLDMAVLSGEVVISDYELNSYSYQACKWMPRGWSWVDPVKEVNACIMAVRAGFMTQADVISQAGGDFDEFLVQRKSEIDASDSLALVFDTNPKQVTDKGQIQPNPVATDAAATGA